MKGRGMTLLQAFTPHTALQARPIAAGDLDFLRALYASVREEEMAAAGWPADAQDAFLTQQFEFQHRYYHEHYADAEFLLLQHDGCSIGRLYWHAGGTHASLMDVSLLRPWRGRGLGSALMQMVTDHADTLDKPIELHVEPTNPALHLYGRFGFAALADNGVYVKMRRSAMTDRACAAGAAA
jgi:GNAT superfamily N-acetyltransferase